VVKCPGRKPLSKAGNITTEDAAIVSEKGGQKELALPAGSNDWVGSWNGECSPGGASVKI